MRWDCANASELSIHCQRARWKYCEKRVVWEDPCTTYCYEQMIDKSTLKWPWNCSESALLKIGASILNIWGSQQKFMGKDQTQAEKQCLKYMQPTIVGVLFTFLLWASANAFYICYEKFASIWVSGTIRIFAMQQSTLRIQWGRVKYVA